MKKNTLSHRQEAIRRTIDKNDPEHTAAYIGSAALLLNSLPSDKLITDASFKNMDVDGIIKPRAMHELASRSSENSIYLKQAENTKLQVPADSRSTYDYWLYSRLCDENYQIDSEDLDESRFNVNPDGIMTIHNREIILAKLALGRERDLRQVEWYFDNAQANQQNELPNHEKVLLSHIQKQQSQILASQTAGRAFEVSTRSYFY